VSRGCPISPRRISLYMRDVLSLYQEKELIRKDIYLEFLSLLMVYFNFAMSEFINMKYRIHQTSPTYAVSNEILKEYAENLIDIIKRGMKV